MSKKLIKIIVPLILLIVAGLFSCATLESGITQPVKENTVSAPKTKDNESESTYKIKELLENGLKYLDQGSISVGISQLVAVLAEGSKISAPGDDVKSLINEAETTLAKIGSSITMETGSEWLDENKNQINADTLSLGTKEALQPSIILIYNMGTSGKTLIPVLLYFLSL